MQFLEAQKVVARLKRVLFHKANAYSIGMFKSHFRGSGLQFKEHRLYEHGDDPRFIDWKATARTGESCLKTFDEERNIEIVVLLDTSLSMFQGHKGISKFEAAVQIISLLYMLADETKDLVHLILVGEKLQHIPPSRGDEGIIKMVSTLERFHYLKKDQFAPPITSHKKPEERLFYAEIMKHLSHKREIVVFSDFYELTLLPAITKLVNAARIHCFQLKTPLDYAKRLPYLIDGIDVEGKGVGLRKIKLHEDLNAKAVLKDKLKILNIHDRYLEGFVKEML